MEIAIEKNLLTGLCVYKDNSWSVLTWLNQIVMDHRMIGVWIFEM